MLHGTVGLLFYRQRWLQSRQGSPLESQCVPKDAATHFCIRMSGFLPAVSPGRVKRAARLCCGDSVAPHELPRQSLRARTCVMQLAPGVAMSQATVHQSRGWCGLDLTVTATRKEHTPLTSLSQWHTARWGAYPRASGVSPVHALWGNVTSRIALCPCNNEASEEK